MNAVVNAVNHRYNARLERLFLSASFPTVTLARAVNALEAERQCKLALALAPRLVKKATQ